MVVYFIDTTVLCNLVPVPGRDNDRVDVLSELQKLVARRDVLVLPVAAVIETGNFIAQLSGRQRRQAATALEAQLRLAANNQAPYVFHDFSWDAAFVHALLEGAGTGSSFIDHATAGLGAGDLTILTEIASYRARTRLPVRVWTKDQQLDSYN